MSTAERYPDRDTWTPEGDTDPLQPKAALGSCWVNTVNPMIRKSSDGWLRVDPGVTHVMVPGQGTWERVSASRWAKDGRWKTDESMAGFVEAGAWCRSVPKESK